MKHMKRAFAMLMCVAMILSLCTMFASAANVCEAKDITGNADSNATVTFYVSTKSKWKFFKDSITLTATSGKLIHPTWSSDTKADSYGFYEVSWYKKSGDNWKLVDSKKWEDKETCSVTSLKRSTEYKITVRPYTMDEIFSKHRLAYSTNFGCIVLLPVQTIGGGLKLDGMGLETYDNSTCKPTPDEFKWDTLPTWTVSSTSAGIMTCSK